MNVKNIAKLKYEYPLDFTIICLCAFRYALGRMTYITDIVPNFILNNIDAVDLKDLKIMVREIEERETIENGLGMNIDRNTWMDFKEKLKMYIENIENAEKVS